jgi:hypothetical protein
VSFDHAARSLLVVLVAHEIREQRLLWVVVVVLVEHLTLL